MRGIRTSKVQFLLGIQDCYFFPNSSQDEKLIFNSMSLSLVPANLSEVPQTHFVLFNHSSPLWCLVDGEPAPRIVSRKNGDVVQNSTSVRYRLSITEEERSTNYSCEVDDDGQLRKKNISLVVESKHHLRQYAYYT